MGLSDRKKKILTAVVEEYIRTAEPVGSKTILQNSDLNCSSATIRNELAELASLGYLDQPHTSAGRVPTPKGYRIYVNELMDRNALSFEETETINNTLDERINVYDPGSMDIGKLTSQLTNYPAVTFTEYAPATIQRFDIIYVDANTFIIVVMLSNNTVKNKLVHLPVSATKITIQTLSSLFNANFTGKTDEQITPQLISNTERAAGETVGLTRVIASFVIEVLEESHSTEGFIAGENRLLSQPEYKNPEKAHQLINYLSSGGNVLSGTELAMQKDEVRVLIGPENVAEELKDSSVIIASYDAGDNMRGIIGVVGPTRMDYSAVAAKLKFLADGLSKRLGNGEAPPPGLNNKLIIKGDND